MSKLKKLKYLPVDMKLLETVFFSFCTSKDTMDITFTREFDNVLFPKFKKPLKDNKLIMTPAGKRSTVALERTNAINNIKTDLANQVAVQYSYATIMFFLDEDNDTMEVVVYEVDCDYEYYFMSPAQKEFIANQQKAFLEDNDCTNLVMMTSLIFPSNKCEVGDFAIDLAMKFLEYGDVYNRYLMNEYFKVHCRQMYPEITQHIINNDDVSKLGQYIKDLHCSPEYLEYIKDVKTGV